MMRCHSSLVIVVLTLLVAWSVEGKKHPRPPRAPKILHNVVLPTSSSPALQLHTTPLSLPDSGGELSVSWEKLEIAPSPWDVIGISCGPQVSVGDFYDYKQLGKLAEMGVHHVEFSSLPNLFCDYEVTYNAFNESTQMLERIAIATVKVGTGAGKNGVRHVRIAVGDDASEMWVSFTTEAGNERPFVLYGTSVDVLDKLSTGDMPSTYTAEMLCHAPANVTSQTTFRSPGFMNHVLLKDLIPGQRYFYVAGIGNETERNHHHHRDVRSFVAAARAGEVEKTVFAGYGDMGVPPDMPSAADVCGDLQQDSQIEFVLHFGDISYARGAAYNWETFHSQIEPIASRLPYMVSIGNHEYDHTAGGEKDPSGAGGDGFHPSWGNYGSDSGGECGVPVVNRFKTPSNGRGVFWYSFNFGLVHVVMLSSEHNWTRGSEQFEWFESDLKSVNRSSTPWIVVTTHRMFYPTQFGEDSDWVVAEHMREEMEDLLVTYKVNLLLCGHQHSVQISPPIAYGQVVASGQAPVHIIVGTAGYDLEGGGFQSNSTWSAWQSETHHGYCRFSATREAMGIEFVALGQKAQTIEAVKLVPWW